MRKERVVEVDSGSGEIRFPKVNEEGYPVDPNKVPSYEEALRVLVYVDKLLSGSGPGARKRLEKAKLELRRANDYAVWTSNMLSREAGLFPISAKEKGSFMDPASESYHSM